MPAARILPAGPETFRPHALHRGQRDWIESNCYLDVWVEVLHALDLEPIACLGFALASDFEGDQWTFTKPSNFDLLTLYGLSIEEMTIWQSLEDHCLCQLELGRLPLVEVDAYHLPDAALTDYGKHHVKTTIAVSAMDTTAQCLEYFHNAGYFRLDGADYRGVFRLGDEHVAIGLPPYCEMVKLNRRVARPTDELRRMAFQQSRQHAARGPDDNPLERFSEVFDVQMQQVIDSGEAAYHDYAFATLRQLGAASEYAAIHLEWLAPDREGALSSAAAGFREVSSIAKGVLLKGARMVARGRITETSAQWQAMSAAWMRARRALVEAMAL